jgi:hypothetical protein
VHPEGGVGDLNRHPLPQILGKGFRTKIKKPLPGARRGRDM